MDASVDSVYTLHEATQALRLPMKLKLPQVSSSLPQLNASPSLEKKPRKGNANLQVAASKEATTLCPIKGLHPAGLERFPGSVGADAKVCAVQARREHLRNQKRHETLMKRELKQKRWVPVGGRGRPPWACVTPDKRCHAF